MSNWENSDPNTGPNPWTATFGGGNPTQPPSQQTTGGAPLYGGGGGGGGNHLASAAAATTPGGFDPQNLIFNPHDGHYSAFKRSIGPNGVYGYETVDVGDGSNWNAMAATLGVPFTTLQSMTEQARANAAQVQKGQYGSIRGVYQDGTVAYFDANGQLQRGSSEQAIAAGIPQTDIDRATAEMGQTQRTLVQMGQFTVVGMNPDHSLSVKDYSGNISSVSAADAAAGKIPGVTYSDFLRAFTEYGQGERTAAKMGQYTVVGMGASGVLTVEDFYGHRSEATADHLPPGVSLSEFQAAQSNYIQNQKTATESGTWTATTANPDGTITVRDYFGNTKNVSVDAAGNVIDSTTGQPFKGVSAGQVQQLVQQGVQRDWEGAGAFGPQNQGYAATPALGSGQPAAGSPQPTAGVAPPASAQGAPAIQAAPATPALPTAPGSSPPSALPGPSFPGVTPAAGAPPGPSPTQPAADGGGGGPMTPVPPVAALPGSSSPTASGSPRTAPPSLTPAAQAQYAATPAAFDGARQSGGTTGGGTPGALPTAAPTSAASVTGAGAGASVGAAQLPPAAYGSNAGNIPGWTNQQLDLANQTFQNAQRYIQQSNVGSRAFAGGGWSAIGRPSIAGQQ